MITVEKPTRLERYFQQFRKHIVGIDQEFESSYGTQKILYADWTASGLAYRAGFPIGLVRFLCKPQDGRSQKTKVIGSHWYFSRS